MADHRQEIVAMTIYDAVRVHDSKRWDQVTGGVHDYWREVARAVLEALAGGDDA